MQVELKIQYRRVFLDNCESANTKNYGSERIRNSHFKYSWPRVPKGVNRITISAKGKNDLYIALSPKKGGPDDDKKGKKGTPKIGKLHLI